MALFLAEKGANVNLRDNYGWFVLKHEVMKGNAELILKLIQRGADVETRDELEWSSLHLAMNNFKEGSHIRVIKVLLDNNASLNALDMKMRTPLHYLFVKANKRDRCDLFDPFEVIAMVCQKEIEGEDELKFLHSGDNNGNTIMHYMA